MALFTQKDRLAITLIVALVLIGWGIRLSFIERGKPDGSHDVRIIRSAVPIPARIINPDSSITNPGEQISPGGKEISTVVTSVVNINTAELEELKTLPMIGEIKARAIIEYRVKNGPFSNPEDILKVKGIGSATFKKLQPYISVNSSDDRESEN